MTVVIWRRPSATSRRRGACGGVVPPKVVVSPKLIQLTTPNWRARDSKLRCGVLAAGLGSLAWIGVELG